nr:MAG TPA: hypothetical protein [Caudoviricetes sp.]
MTDNNSSFLYLVFVHQLCCLGNQQSVSLTCLSLVGLCCLYVDQQCL